MNFKKIKRKNLISIQKKRKINCKHTIPEEILNTKYKNIPIAFWCEDCNERVCYIKK
jgi:hypothetical protein